MTAPMAQRIKNKPVWIASSRIVRQDPLPMDFCMVKVDKPKPILSQHASRHPWNGSTRIVYKNPKPMDFLSTKQVKPKTVAPSLAGRPRWNASTLILHKEPKPVPAGSKEKKLLLYGRLEMIRFIRAGRFGKVIRAQDSLSGNQVAVKTMDVQDELEREMKFMGIVMADRDMAPVGAGHSVSLLIQRLSDPMFFFAMPLYGCNLSAFISHRHDQSINGEVVGLIDPMQVRRMARQLIEGLVYLNRKHIIHRNLNPKNIMMSEMTEDFSSVKFTIIDLGEATYTADGENRNAGTLIYSPPEAVLPVSYCFSYDTWSLGVIMAEVTLMHHLFENDGQMVAKMSEHDFILNVMDEMGSPPDRFMEWLKRRSVTFPVAHDPKAVPRRDNMRLLEIHSSPFADFVKSCLVWHPFERMEPKDLLEFVDWNHM